jgi:30S ribosomal protein S31
MGKGDRKTRRGKIRLGTYGVRRPRKKKKKVLNANLTSEVEKTEVVESVANDQVEVKEKKSKTKKAK